MNEFPENWSENDKISLMQRRVLINSLVYYEYDYNLITDRLYDSWCRRLVQMMKDYPGDIVGTDYGYAMYDFDGSTGFDLFSRLTEEDKEKLDTIALQCMANEGHTAVKRTKRESKDKPEKEEHPQLSDAQWDAVLNMHNGCILCGGVGSGKSRTALAYYFREGGGVLKPYQPMSSPRDLYIITTAKKRDTREWEQELYLFLLSTKREENDLNGNIGVFIDSWNNIKKYTNVEDAMFIFDEQRVIGYGEWTKAFLKITKKNAWVLLSATPGDTWADYIPVFIANGFYKNRSEFLREHAVYNPYSKYHQIDRYIGITRLTRLRDKILVDMDVSKGTISHHEDIFTDFDTGKYRVAIRLRWDPFNNEPIKDPASLCYILRRIVNEDESRQKAVLELFEKHNKIIIFYNFDYEREILLSLKYGLDVTIAEWNGHKHQEIPTTDSWVYLVQYAAGAEGWNCVKTDTIIFYSQTYSYKMMEQAAGRIDRMDTPYRDLYYYHLKSRASIDLAIAKALKEKKAFNERKFIKW